MLLLKCKTTLEIALTKNLLEKFVILYFFGFSFFIIKILIEIMKKKE